MRCRTSRRSTPTPSAPEALGFESLWAWDHVLLGVEPSFPIIDSITTLGAIAARTSTIKLGTGVLVLPLRNPVVAAKALGSLDVISGGRLILGVAAGWYAREFDAVGVPFKQRGRIFERNLDILLRLWTEERVTLKVDEFNLREAVLVPRTAQRPRPPVLIGGYVDAVLKRAGTVGDGWLTYFYTPESFTKAWQKVQAFAREAGRDPSKLTATNQLAIYVGRNRAETEKDMRHWLSTEWDTAAWSESTIEHAIHGSAGGVRRAAARPRANRREPDYPHPVPIRTRAGGTNRQGGLAKAMTTHIDINCDMGESYGRWTLGNDEGVMPHITSANIACGFHGGEPHVMRKTVELALKHGVAIGAHPGLPDLMGFGRRRMELSPQEIKDIHRYQVGALGAFVHAAGAKLQHVKAHGIQYHMFEENLELGRASAEQVLELDPNLILMVMAMTKYDAEARKTKVRVAAEGFADRVYADDGQLVSRKLGKDALVSDPAKAAEQAVLMVMEQKVKTITGKTIAAKVDTICIHGDSPGADKIVAAVREGLVKAGATVKPLRDWFKG